MATIPRKVLPVIYDYCHYGTTSALAKVVSKLDGVDQRPFKNGSFMKSMNGSIATTPFTRAMFRVEFDMYVTNDLSLSGYNNLMLTYYKNNEWEFHKTYRPHEAKSHILVFQWDGYVANLNNWTDEFLEYDYIGAPWYWEKQYPVGNGGFSLRSHKLLEALVELNNIIPFNFNNPEDVTICRDYRDLLETKYEIKFAPLDVAKRFSFETGIADVEPFGFHGVWNKIYYDGWDDCILDRDIHTMEYHNSRDKKIYNVHHLQHMTKALFVLGDTVSEAQLYDHITQYYPEHVQYLLHYRQSLDKMPASTFDTWSIL